MGCAPAPATRTSSTIGVAKILLRCRGRERTHHAQRNGDGNPPSTWRRSSCSASAELDHRADIWSLGTILYRCLSGVPPITGTSFGRGLQGGHGSARFRASATSPLPYPDRCWISWTRCSFATARSGSIGFEPVARRAGRVGVNHRVARGLPRARAPAVKRTSAIPLRAPRARGPAARPVRRRGPWGRGGPLRRASPRPMPASRRWTREVSTPPRARARRRTSRASRPSGDRLAPASTCAPRRSSPRPSRAATAARARPNASTSTPSTPTRHV